MPAQVVGCLCFFLLQFAMLGAAHAAETGNANTTPVKIVPVDERISTAFEVQQSAPAGRVCPVDRIPSISDSEAMVRRIAKEEHSDVNLAVAVARQESGFRMDRVSPAGAIGLMQLMPETALRFEVDICDPQDNIRGGVRYLKFLEKKYSNPLYILAAYNAGEAAVEQSGGIPLYPETVRYISVVLADIYDWRPLEDRKLRAAAAHQSRKAPNKPDAGIAGAWTQGFVLHVE